MVGRVEVVEHEVEEVLLVLEGHHGRPLASAGRERGLGQIELERLLAAENAVGDDADALAAFEQIELVDGSLREQGGGEEDGDSCGQTRTKTKTSSSSAALFRFRVTRWRGLPTTAMVPHSVYLKADDWIMSSTVFMNVPSRLWLRFLFSKEANRYHEL